VPARTGRPGYHPSVLLKFFIYGYLNRINFVEAIACNEMALLGDRMIAILHDLPIDFLGDPAECSVPDTNGVVQFTIRDIRISCGGEEVGTTLGRRSHSTSRGTASG